MNYHRALRGSGLLAMAAIFAFACGGGGGTGGTANKGTLKIGVDLPESGAAASSGLPTLHGVELAVKQANDAGGVQGFKIEVDNHDDAINGAYNEQKGVQNVQAMLGDTKIKGMIGPFNSAVARAEIPIAAPQHFTMISPSNTNPCLTHPAPGVCNYDPASLRNGNPNNYFRVVTTDDLQGPAMADYAFKTSGVKKIGVLSDSTVFGQGIATAFQNQFKKDGGDYMRKDFDPATAADFRSQLQAFKDFGATGLYVGGTDDKKSCVPRSQMKAVGFDVPYFGGDGIETTQCIDDAGADGAIGINATTAGADATQVPNAKAAVDAFHKQFPGPNDYGSYSIQAYDAAKALMEAIGRAVNNANGNEPSREQVRSEMAKTKNFHGAIGTYNFDSNGDTDLKFISVYTTKQVANPADSAGVCGTKAPNTCFVFTKQFNFGAGAS